MSDSGSAKPQPRPRRRNGALAVLAIFAFGSVFLVGLSCAARRDRTPEPKASAPGAASRPIEHDTTLSDPSIKYTVPASGYVTLKRGPVEAVIVDNRAVDDATLKGHRAGYAGVASLTHAKRRENLFVPAYAGLNFEHIHDGTTQARDVLYEPRNAPMELRVIDPHTAELYQKPTPHWGLESCQRFELLEDGTIELTIDVIPRNAAFKHNYIGLFWASYIHQPESTDVHFFGRAAEAPDQPAHWVRAASAEHGVNATHLGASDAREFAHDADFPMKLVFNRSAWRYDQPWFFGVSHGMAYVQVFRASDSVRLTQSPSGGGQGNPAWDFQFFITDPKVGQSYRFAMRAVYTPFTSAQGVSQTVAPHLSALK